MNKPFSLLPISILIVKILNAQPVAVRIASGILEGQTENGIVAFKGIPYAQAPVGALRWKETQPVRKWTGVRKANPFGGRAMQQLVYRDMVFRSPGINEDCLYLKVWTGNTS